MNNEESEVCNFCGKEYAVGDNPFIDYRHALGNCRENKRLKEKEKQDGEQ